jgi:hypothetical protein
MAAAVDVANWEHASYVASTIRLLRSNWRFPHGELPSAFGVSAYRLVPNGGRCTGTIDLVWRLAETRPVRRACAQAPSTAGAPVTGRAQRATHASSRPGSSLYARVA